MWPGGPELRLLRLLLLLLLGAVLGRLLQPDPLGAPPAVPRAGRRLLWLEVRAPAPDSEAFPQRLRGGPGVAPRLPSPAPPHPSLCAFLRLCSHRQAHRAPAPGPLSLHQRARPRRRRRGRRSLPVRPARRPRWTFRLQPLRPRDSAARVVLGSVPLSGPHPDLGPALRARCPPGEAEDLDASDPDGRLSGGVACQGVCVIHQVKIDTGQRASPVHMTKKTEESFQVTKNFQCSQPHGLTQNWRVYAVPTVGAIPDWKKPLQLGSLDVNQKTLTIRIPRNTLDWGVYLFNFSLAITQQSGAALLQKSDAIYVVVGKSLLQAVLLGDHNTTINFVDTLVLNGSTSSDPDADDPLEGLHFFWYCTTNLGNYQRDKVTVKSKEVCLAKQADSLQWRTPPTSALTLQPQTLKGNLVYFFRMMIEKGDRTAFADKRVNVLRGLAPRACIACIENCDAVLVTSERFSLYVNCTGCTTSDVYRWSIRTQTGQEVQFDWGVQTTTGRDSEYLYFKALAFKDFTEATFWISAHVIAWSGWDLVFRHSFIVNHIPRVGDCNVKPPKGISLVTKYVVRCDNFHDLNTPLTYKIVIADLYGFAEISSLKENNLGIILHMGTKSSSPPSFFPVGPKANHFAMRLYAQVYDVLGAYSRVTFSAVVQPPSDSVSSETLLEQLRNFTTGPQSTLAMHLLDKEFLRAGYFTYVIASVLNSMKDEPALLAERVQLREHLVNQTFLLPMTSLVEISQVVMVLAKLTQRSSEFSTLARKLATLRTWQTNAALQEFQRNSTSAHSEQTETVCTGILTSLSNLLELRSRRELIEQPLHLLQSLAETVLAGKVPGNETTVLQSSSVNMYVKKMDTWQVGELCTLGGSHGSCFRPTLNTNNHPQLATSSPISTTFCEFAKDPFPWLSYRQNSSAQVVGMRMTGLDAQGKVLEITPDVTEVFLVLRNPNGTVFNLTMSPDNETKLSDKSLGKTTGGFKVDVDCRTPKELLVQIVTQVTMLFTASVYAGDQMDQDALVATFLVPHDIPPVANHSTLFDPNCVVKKARVLCLPSSLLDVIAQRSLSTECSMVVLLEASRFILNPTDKLVQVSVFRVQCVDMEGIQSEWRDYTCGIGEQTTLERVHCVCKSRGPGRHRRSLTQLVLHTRYLTAKMIVAPNPVDLRLVVVKKITQNPVALFTVLFLLVMYIVLAFWALHRDETDQFLREYVIVLPDNDPYDNVCYLVTVFTGSRCGSGTRSNVFVQLLGTQGDSSVHCLTHPHFTTLFRGSINSFLLATKSDLGDVHSVRVWHNNEGDEPSWYLSRVKVENLFSRQIWLFMCREWLSVDTALDRTFHAIPPDQPLRKEDFFLIDVSYNLGKNHLWFSVFLGVISKPFNRLQRLSCCLAMLMASLLCNIMFFNLSQEEEREYEGGQYVRAMVIGLESAIITLPVQLAITFLFTYSQRRPQVTLEAVTPEPYPWLLEDSGHWEDNLEKWHSKQLKEEPAKEAKEAEEAKEPKKVKGAKKAKDAKGAKGVKGAKGAKKAKGAKGAKGAKEPSQKKTAQRGRASSGVAADAEPKPKKARSRAPSLQRANANASNRNVNNNQKAPPGDPQQPPAPADLSKTLQKKPRVVLHHCWVYVAWFLVFATSSISSFFIVFYGLTYGYEKSVDWLFASFCSFCQSVLIIQVLKVILITGFRTNQPKYSKNLSWVGSHRYSEIKLEGRALSPSEMERLHQRVLWIRGTRMYQPLTEDEIRIFRRKKRVRRRAYLFLCYILTHFIFLALLLCLLPCLRHADTFYYNQFLREHFSAGLARVSRLVDVYGWLTGVALPLFHNDLNPTFLPDTSSKILGLPLMRQVRAKPGEKVCPPSRNFVQNRIGREIHCHAKYGIDPEDTHNYAGSWKVADGGGAPPVFDGFAYKPPEKRWPYHTSGVLHTYGSGGYAFYFFPELQQFNSTLRLRELQKKSWLDEKTWAVIVDLTTFNADVSLFCSISVIFEVSELGVVNSSVSVHAFSLADFDRKTSAEIYLYVAILIFFVAYTVDEGYVISQERAAYPRSVYNQLNLALKCIFTVLVVLFLVKHFLARGVVDFHRASPREFAPFHAVSHVDRLLRVTLGFLLFLTTLKTLRYSRFFYDVRLAQRAIQTALPCICHMALVVAVYFFVYMAFGYLVFGQHEWSYCNLVHAMQTIFSYCVSAFQNTAFSNSRVLGLLFLSSFMLVMICILINLFQAVILSAYEEMKQPVYEEPSDEAEAVTFLCRRLRTAFDSLSATPRPQEDSEFVVDMLYGQPRENSRRYLGLKTRNINGKKMVYLVV